MNAPPPSPLDAFEFDDRCPATLLAVPECSCRQCLTQLMRTQAPGLLRAEAQPAS